MLSAFAPRPIVELKPRDKSRIESLLAFGDRLLVGLSTGSLRVYRVNEVPVAPADTPPNNGESQPTPKTKAVELLREEEKFSKKPVTQMAIIKEVNTLISLSDGYIFFHDMQSYTLSERLDKTKGASAFAVTSNIVKDAKTGIPSIVSRLAVAVKRRMLVWTWQDMELTESSHETVLPASIKSMTWASGTKMVIGMDPGYVVVDTETQKSTEINRPAVSGEATAAAGIRFGAVHTSGMGYMGIGSWVPRPLSTRLSEGQMLLAKDVNTLFIDGDGVALEKRQVPWALAPEAIAYSYPYLLALQPSQRGVLEIRNPETLSLLQSVPLPNAAILHVPQPYISLAHAGKGFLVASERCIWRMGALGYNSQIDDLLRKNLFDEALSLVGMLEDTLLDAKDERLREIRIQKAQHLFKKKNYRAALELFADAEAPPARVIALYPASISGIAVTSHVAVEEDDRPKGDDEREQVEAVKPSAVHASILDKVKNDSGKHSSDAASIRSGATPVRTQTPDSNGGRGSGDLIDDKDLHLAVNELNAFLAQTRAQLQRYINYDGTLKTPMSQSEEDASQPTVKPAFEHLIVQDDNTGKDIDWQRELYAVATLVDTTLFRAYMLTRPTLAGPLFRLDNFCAPDVVEEKLYESKRYNDLIDFLYGKKLHREALELLQKFGKDDNEDEAVDESLRGPQRTVRYLQQLPFEKIDTILQFAAWPIKADPDLGMEIFLADTEMAETLPRGRVLAFLQDTDSDLAMRYLEHVIDEFHDETPDFHDQLVGMYLDRLRQDHAEGSQQSAWQGKLEDMLRQSEHYNKAKILRDLSTAQGPHFLESRIIVLNKLSRHKEALEIYVFQLADYQKAEEYCNQVYLSSSTSTSTPSTTDPDDTSAPESVYTSLLALYLTPPAGRPTNLDTALDLLSRHGSRLPAQSTLALLPATQPIRSLESYFVGRMRAANSLAREEAVVAALGGVAKAEAEAALLLGARGRRVVVGENRLCSVCHKRFGRAAIRVWPDGDVVHYGCVERGRHEGVVGSGGGAAATELRA